MKSGKRFRSITVCLTLALGAVACAPAGRMGPGGEAGGRDGLRHARMPGNGMQIRLRDTALQLKLTPQQVPLWNEYERKVSLLLSDMLRAQPEPPPNLSAMQEIGRKVDIARDRLAAMEDVADAAARLYGSLSAEQKKVADLRLAATVPSGDAGLDDGYGDADTDSPRPAGDGGRAGRAGGGVGRHGRTPF
jgi:LTXXQ motif family protein